MLIIYKLIFSNASLRLGLFWSQLQGRQVKNMNLHQDSNPGLASGSRRSINQIVDVKKYSTREVFLRKNIVAVLFFQKCAIYPDSKYISFPLNEIIQA